MKTFSGITSAYRDGKHVVLDYQDLSDSDLDTLLWFTRKQAVNLAIAILEATE